MSCERFFRHEVGQRVLVTRDTTMKQMTLAATRGFEKHGRATRKAAFLARMESLIPWAEFCALIEPHCPKAGNGRPPMGLERMLLMNCGESGGRFQLFSSLACSSDN